MQTFKKTCPRLSFNLLSVSLGWLTATACGVLPTTLVQDPESGGGLEVLQAIVNGNDADAGEYPWMAALVNPRQNNFQFCGGILIAPEWVLTAGHCLQTGARVDNVNTVNVVVGRTDLTSDTGEQITVAEAFVHPAYRSLGATYFDAYISSFETYPALPVPKTPRLGDIGLLRLSQPATVVNTFPDLATVSDAPLYDPGTVATAVGWGAISETGDGSDILQEVEVPVVSNAVCNSPESYAGAVKNDMICAGFPEGGKDACFGDSGGPLAIPVDSDNWLIIGLTSTGDGCARPNKYGVYTRVSSYINWINSIVE
ncbi:MAG: serine protease [Cyanobacteriota bacterium]|nr:serine protease [Cyanobacteriota bacterium]